MSAIEWSDDGETVACPACGETWGDNWDYNWGTREEIEIECPHCLVPLTLHRSISVDYGISRAKVSDETTKEQAQ